MDETILNRWSKHPAEDGHEKIEQGSKREGKGNAITENLDLEEEFRMRRERNLKRGAECLHEFEITIRALIPKPFGLD